jgi:hypothetical protein
MKAILVSMLLALASPASMTQGASPTGVSSPDPAVPVTLGQPVVALTGPWKFHIGDDPRWADPGFDDSGWQPYVLMPGGSVLTPEEVTQSGELPGWQQYGHPGYTGYAWYRIRLRPPENVQSIALLMPRNVNDAYEVYLNGSKIGAFGKLNGFHLVYLRQPELFSIPAATLNGGQPVVLALRFWNMRREASPGQRNLAGGLRGVPVIGPSSLLRILKQSVQGQMWQAQTEARLMMVVACLYGAVGFISLFLFLFSHGQKEYLWAGISLTGFGAMLAAIICEQEAAISVQTSVVAQTVADAAAIFAMPMAAMYLLDVPRSFWRRANYVESALNLTWSVQLAGFSLGLLPPTAAAGSLRNTTLGLSVLLLGCLLLAIAIDGVRKIGRKAWLPMAPGILFAFYCILYTLYSLEIFKGSYRFPTLICACVPITVLIIFLMRFTEQQRQNVRMSDDMRQAEEVQHLLVPQQLPDFPGWLIESEYHPARQVGGDFFQVLPGDDGCLLIVVGDVSGKGLKAAMTVSAIVGALRGCTVRAPAMVLAYLNNALHGQVSGFFTCCAALINAEDRLTVANAGHLPPYVNGEELKINPGLPLGIDVEAAYPETTHDLCPDDRLTFISDGVVEARNSRGELYGFARTKSVSSHTAAAIARAAQEFGQEDDITVLTVMRAPTLERSSMRRACNRA